MFDQSGNDLNGDFEALPYNYDDIIGLSSDVRLRRESNKITYAFIPHMSLDYGTIRPEVAVVLSCFNGKRTFEQVVKMIAIASSLNFERALRLVTKTVRFITPDLKMLVEADGRTLYSPPDFKDLLIKPELIDIDARLDAPLVMMLQPTLVCETDCIYCYAVRRNIPNKDLLSLERITEIFDECVEIGVYQVNLCGGDGFVRPDFVDIIAACIDRGIMADISTKVAIDKKLAAQIAKTGLDYLQVSIDSSREEVADKLYGCSGHFLKVVESIKNLIDAGVYTRTNSIITPYNLDHVEETVDFIVDLGIDDLKLTPSFRSMHKDNLHCLLSQEQLINVEKEVNRLAERFKKRGVTISFSMQDDYTFMTDEERSEYWFNKRPICSGGRANITVAPDGLVTICEEAPQTPEFQVGDLKKQSIVDVWNSDALKQFTYPDREAFSGTACENCKEFDGCVHYMGHCFRDSLKVYGKPFVPNPFCPSAPAANHRVY